MGEALGAIYLAAAGLLVAAGLPKLRDPLPLVRALRSTGLPGTRGLVRVLAAGEVALGVGAVLLPVRVTAVLLAVAYAVFTAFVVLALRRGGVLGSCGCFGRPDTPPTATHVVLTAVTAAACAASALDPVGTLAGWTATPLHGGAVAGYALLLGALGYLVIGVLPTVSARAVRSATAAAPARREATT